MGPFSDLHRQILHFEADRRLHHPSKKVAIRNRFGLSLYKYYKIRAWVAEQPEAEAFSPALVRQLRFARNRSGPAAVEPAPDRSCPGCGQHLH